MLLLYNSLGRKLTKFAPTSGKNVRMYTCGPTVYNYSHIGNFRTFVFEDILRRHLEHKGYRVVQVKNITDVEDRIIEGIKTTGKSLRELTDFFTQAFMDDLDALNIQRAEQYPRATEFIDEIVSTVSSLMKKGYAYRADDGSVYFSIRKFPKYGKLSGIKQEEAKSGTRVAVDHYEKMGANDFALWKAWDPADGDVFWETSLGKGRPGWHIECSVMAMKYLGPSFDIHTGGKDLKFPHHENEIAQSEGLTGKRFVKYWLHSEFLNINGEKMSKSLGNFVTFRDLRKQGWSAKAIRLFLISAHYRDELNLTDTSMSQADATMRKIEEFIERVSRGAASAKPGRASLSVPLVKSLIRSFDKAMDDDLNTPMALAALFGFQRKVNVLLDSKKLSKGDYKTISDALKDVDSVLGLKLADKPSTGAGREKALVAGEDAEIEDLVREREQARRQKDYSKADVIRAKLQEKGVTVQDTADGPVWRRLSTAS